MKKYGFIISVLFMALVNSCSEIEEKVSTVMDKSKLEQCDGPFSSALSKFEIIPLETNDDCLIGEIDVMKKRNGRYYIQSARKTLLVFEEDGKFVMQVGRIGGGPGEYEIISDIDADEHSIYLLSFNKLLVYGLDGSYKKTISLKQNVRTIRKVKDGFLVFLNTPVGENCLGYMDENGEMKVSELKKTEPLRLVRPLSWVRLDNHTYVYQMSYSNNLYCFDENKKEFYLKDMINDDAVTIDILESVGDIQQISGLMFDGLVSSGNQLAIGGMKSGTMYFYQYGVDGGRIFDVSKVEDDVTYSQWAFLKNIGSCDSDDDCLFTFMEANVLQEAFEEGNVVDIHPYSLLKEVDEENNPVILRYRFK